MSARSSAPRLNQGDPATQEHSSSAAELRAILRDVGPQVLRTCRGIVGPDECEDAAQESLAALARAIPAFRGDSSMRTYAVRIAMRTALRMRRRRARREERELLTDAPPEAPATSPNDETRLERRRIVWALLDELPPPQAEALALRFILGHSLAEVAEACDAPLNTIRSRIRLARCALQQRLEANTQLRDALEPIP